MSASRNSAGRAVALASLVVAMVPTASAPAATIGVPGDFGTIQAAIAAAMDGDEIVVAPGLYPEQIDFLGKAITVRSVDPEDDAVVAATVIDGGADANPATADGPVVTFATGETQCSVLAGFTIRAGGGVFDAVFGSKGGGIYCDDTRPHVYRNVIELNTAGLGAGVYLRDGGGIFERNFIRQNLAGHSGGGIKLEDFPLVTVRSNVISGNRATPGFVGGIGGGIDCFDLLGGVDIRNNVIAGNYSDISGAGISATDASPDLFGNIVTDNRGGTGIFGQGTRTPTICWNDVWGNAAGAYGGNAAPCGAGELSADPQFVTFGFWDDVNSTPGDPTDDVWVDGDYRLTSGSPCIDAGDPAFTWDRGELDREGDARFAGLGIDMGADEFGAVPLAAVRLVPRFSFAEMDDPCDWVPALRPNASTDVWFVSGPFGGAVWVDTPAATADLTIRTLSGNPTVGELRVRPGADLTSANQYIGWRDALDDEAVALFGNGLQEGGANTVLGTLYVPRVETFFTTGVTSATYEMTDGTLSAGEIRVGDGYRAVGSFRQFGGAVVTTGDLVIAMDDFLVYGEYEQLGGTVDVGGALVVLGMEGNGGSAFGRYILAGGGQLSATALRIGVGDGAGGGRGEFLQFGGTVDIAGTLLIATAQSEGSYDLMGGMLLTGNTVVAASCFGGSCSNLGEVTIDGGTWINTGSLQIGDDGVGYVLLRNGAMVSTGDLSVGGGSDGCGAIWLTGPATSLTAGTIFVGASTGCTGTLEVLDGAVATGDLVLPGGTAGTATVSGTGAQLNATGVVEVEAGSLHSISIRDGGTLVAPEIVVGSQIRGDGDFLAGSTITYPGFAGPSTVVADINCIGSVEPGSDSDPFGTLTLDGRLTQTGVGLSGVVEAGQTVVEIGGPTPGVDHDVLDFANAIDASGEIVLDVVNGFDPPVGQTFQVGSYGTSVVKVFDFVTSTVFPDGRFLRLSTVSNFAGAGGAIVATVESLPALLGYGGADTVGVGGVATDVAIGDFNGDLFPDVAITVPSSTSPAGLPGDVLVLINDGNDAGGTWLGFDPADIVQVPVGVNPSGLVVDELDGVNGPDIAVTNFGDGTISVLLNDGGGGFLSQVVSAVGTEPASIGAGDFDGDLTLDLVVANSGDGTVTVLRPLGGGSYGPIATFGAGDKPGVLDPEDFDNDKDLDLVVATEVETSPGTFEPRVTVHRNVDGSGTFATPPTFYATGVTADLTTADVNNDLFPDVLVADASSSAIGILLNEADGTASLQGAVAQPITGIPISLVAADVDGDTDPDIAAVVDTGGPTRELAVLSNLIDGGTELQFLEEPAPPVADNPLLIAAADVDQDGFVNLVTVNEAGGSLAEAGAGGAAGSVTALVSCPADFAQPPLGDGQVDVSELLKVLAEWSAGGSPGTGCDVDDGSQTGTPDGITDVSDLLFILARWGACATGG